MRVEWDILPVQERSNSSYSLMRTASEAFGWVISTGRPLKQADFIWSGYHWKCIHHIYSGMPIPDIVQDISAVFAWVEDMLIIPHTLPDGTEIIAIFAR